MRTRNVFAIAIAAALANSPSRAEEWVSVKKTSDSHPTEISLDVSSITVKKNIRIAQTKYVALLPWPDNAQPFDGAAFGIRRVSFDCKSALTKVGSVELHYTDGRMGWLDVKQTWTPAADGFAKKMLRVVCAYKDPKRTGVPRARSRSKRQMVSDA
jgi:hypothetical protein